MYLLVYHLKPKLTSNDVQNADYFGEYAHECTYSTFTFTKSCGDKCYRIGDSFTPSSCMVRSFRNTTVKELLKSVHICQSYPKIMLASFYGTRCIVMLFFSFIPRDAMLSAVYATPIPSVCLSVCLSVIRVYCIKTAELIIEILSLSNRPITLVF